MDEFDESKLEVLKSDYSIFHPTVTQVQIIYDLCDQLSEKINLSKFVLRQLFIKGIVKHQQDMNMFHMTIEQNLPQIRLKLSSSIIDRIYEEFVDILVSPDPSSLKSIKQELDETFRIYIDSYASRNTENDD